MQLEVIEMGKAKGADGVITALSQEVSAIQQSGSGTVNKNTKKNTYNSSSTTVNIKKKKITVNFIKYE